MRRWKLTAILAIVAAISAVLAPRLLGVQTAAPLAAELAVATHSARSIPDVRAPDSGALQAPRSESVIPEVKPIGPAPVHVAVPATPESVPEDFWVDAVLCGMG